MIGHETATDFLRQHTAQDKQRHAYLLTGPTSVGRRTLALRFAQVINCTQPPSPGEYCGKCRSCTLLEKMQHPDLEVVQADQKGATLKVEQVRELQRRLSLAPYEAKYRIALFLRFEEANPNAANALLKTLEEPPSQVIIFLTADTTERLLPTIVSRCEVLRLRPASLQLLQEALHTNYSIPEEQARLLAHLSGGRPGYALRLHQQPELLKQRQDLLDDHYELLCSNLVKRFAYCEKVSKEKTAMLDALEVWTSFWRDVLVQSTGAISPLNNIDHSEVILRLAGQMPPQKASLVISSINRTVEMLDRNANARLALEVLMLDLPRF